MSSRLFPRAKQRFANVEIDFDSDTIRFMPLDLTVADTAVKQITGATAATPGVITSASHGGANGDLACVSGIVGTTTLNQLAFLANVTTNTFTLKSLDGNLDVVGVGAYVSGGRMINLTQAITLDLINGGRILDGGAVDITLSGCANTLGVLDATDAANTGITGTPHATIIYKFVTNDAGSFPILYQDGKVKMRVAADAASSATTLWCDPLPSAIPAGATIPLSNGVTATVPSGAAQGAVSLTVSALSGAVPANHQGEVGTTNNGYGNNYATATNVTWIFDNGPAKLCVL